MNDLKERWVKALRSGRYRQHRSALSNRPSWADTSKVAKSERNCCLGVLCRVARTPTPKWRNEALLRAFPEGKDLRRRLGMDYRQENKLARLNDKGATFSEIATWIEENL